MINVTLGEVKQHEIKPFPKIMKTVDGYVVYFIRYGSGICFEKPSDASDTIGDYSTGWNMENFTDYNEPITIQNA